MEYLISFPGHFAIKQFDAKGRRQKQIPHRPFLGIHDQLVALFYSSDFLWQFFVVLIRWLKQAVFFLRPESLR